MDPVYHTVWIICALDPPATAAVNLYRSIMCPFKCFLKYLQETFIVLLPKLWKQFILTVGLQSLI